MLELTPLLSTMCVYGLMTLCLHQARHCGFVNTQTHTVCLGKVGITMDPHDAHTCVCSLTRLAGAALVPPAQSLPSAPWHHSMCQVVRCCYPGHQTSQH
jgi:hypothetical protein